MPTLPATESRLSAVRERSVRVATYNLYLGADLTLIFGAQSPGHLLAQAQLVHQQLQSTNFPERADAIAALLVREQIDVVGLQEVARWEKGPMTADGTQATSTVWCDFLAELLRALARTGTPYDAHAENPNFAGSGAISESEYLSVVGHNVILVRRSSGIAVTSEVTGAFGRSLNIGTGVDNLVLTIRRGWSAIEAELGDARWLFACTHTEAYDLHARNAQRDELLGWLAHRRSPAVVVGDFNAKPDQVGMPSSYQDAWLVAGGNDTSGDGNTCGQAPDLTNPESSLSERIDYIWVNGAEVIDCRVVGNKPADRTAEAKLWPSDHACVLADVVL